MAPSGQSNKQSSLICERVDRWALDTLVHAARALLEDEGAQAPSMHGLRLRLHRRLSTGGRAWIFRTPDRTPPIAFALCSSAGTRVRIEQFRVEADVRRHGWGRRCVKALLVGPLASAETVEVRVLEDNAPALAFWHSEGFRTEVENPVARLRMSIRNRPQSI